MRFFLWSLCILLFFACSQNSNNKDNSKQDLANKIAAYEDSLYNQDNFAYLNDVMVERAIEHYVSYAEKYPEEELSPEYLFKAANLYRYKRKFFEALQVYTNIQENYPEFDKTPQCLFLQAFIFENELGDLENARILYESFLEKYPDDPFAKDAKHCLDNLGKPLDEIIKEFEDSQEEEAI
ncbi:MAG: tetratricopeptide repeat protein [Chitinophagales bacterium]|nr:tetratricopeptide repeat protein [Chitinophagales bacterium]